MSTLNQILANDIDSIGAQLGEFIWSFNHGDNIIYNFEVLQALYVASNKASKRNLFNKPITVTIVSIVEAILIDFLTRIDQATNHLPANIDRATLYKIKAEVKKAKRPQKVEDDLGERIYMRRKMYQFKELVAVFEKYELFGTKGDDIYNQLREFGDMRNRVHIENYHGNFERKEHQVFTSDRLASLEKVLSELWNKMVTDYKRPWRGSETQEGGHS